VLKKINRISTKTEFELVKTKGVMHQSPIFGWLALKLDDNNKKVGFLVSKKISKKAVDRNRIRRVLAVAIKKNLEAMPGGLRCVVLAKKTMLGVEYATVEKEVARIISEINEKNSVVDIKKI
jgi:ribonuclease P protein component